MTTEVKSAKPSPIPTATSEPYWNAAHEGQLTLQFCPTCEEFVFYPRPLCGKCNKNSLEWRPISGRGVVYTYSVVHRAPSAEFREDIPYVVGLVDLDEGVRMMTSILTDPDQVSIGSRVVVDFDARDSATVPVFRLEQER